MLLTTKGVFRFDDSTKEIYLSQVHHGVSVESVKKDVPWNLKVADDLCETARPTDVEIAFVRHFAPTEVVGRKLMYELGLTNAFNKALARGK